MKIQDFCRNRPVKISANATLQEAAEPMEERCVGSLVVEREANLILRQTGTPSRHQPHDFARMA